MSLNSDIHHIEHMEHKEGEGVARKTILTKGYPGVRPITLFLCDLCAPFGELIAVSRMSRVWLLSAVIAIVALPPLVRGEGNLVRNGDFEVGVGGIPAAWDKPDGLGAAWAESSDREGRAIRLDTSVSEQAMQASWERAGLTNQWSIPKPAGNGIADTYGLSYYSTNFPCVSGATYRVTCDTRGPGPVKVWVRGYGLFRERRVRRYEAVMNCAASPDTWQTTTMEFNPTARRPEVDELRVMLYAWYPPGVYWFDRVRVERVDHELHVTSPAGVP